METALEMKVCIYSNVQYLLWPYVISILENARDLPAIHSKYEANRSQIQIWISEQMSSFVLYIDLNTNDDICRLIVN